MNSPERPGRDTPARYPQSRSTVPLTAREVSRFDNSHPPVNSRIALRAMTRHWWQILALWLVGSGVLGAVIMAKLKPSYEASSILRIEPATHDLFGTGLSAAENFEAYLQTQVQLVLGSKVLAEAVEKLNSAPSAKRNGDHWSESALRRLLQVQVVPRTFLIEVGTRSTSPTEASAIVNAVVDAYLNLASEWADGATRTHIANLETYYKKLESQVAEKQKQWLDLADKGDVEPLAPRPSETKGALGTTKHSITLDHYKHLTDNLLQARAELIEADSIVTIRRGRKVISNNNAARNKKRAQDAAQLDPDVSQIAEQLRTALHQRDDARRRVRYANDPALSRVQQKVDSLSERYRKLVTLKENEILTRLESNEQDPNETLVLAEEKAASLRLKVSGLEQMLDKLEVRNKQEGGDAVRVALIQESLTSLREMQVAVTKRLEQYRFVARGEPRISRISEAEPASQPIKDSRMKAMVVAPVGLMMSLLAFFVLLEVRADRIGDPDDFSARGKFEVLGVVPPLPAPQPPSIGERAALEYSNRVQELDQSLEHLQVALCGASNNGNGRCVMITSATGGEGKTHLAVQLAARCARSGESTLLIDADLRRTVLGQLLDLDKGPGLSDILQGDVPVVDALIEGQVGGFHLLPSGTRGQDPGRLLKGRILEQLLDGLRRTYDVIIIDTPPVLPVPDALILGHWCDAAILAVRYDNSRFPLVERARRRLAAAGVPLLGAVVTGMRPSKASYGTYVYSSNNGSSSSGVIS